MKVGDVGGAACDWGWWRTSAARISACVFTLLLSLCLAALTGPARADDLPPPYAVAPIYDGVAISSFYIRGYDGTRLAITLYRPTRNGMLVEEPMPVVVRQMRGQNGNPNGMEDMRYFTQRGYVWVTQTRRGTGASFGTETGFITHSDAQDARAAIEWAGAQPFSTGAVVTYGCSNEGLWQYRVMALQPKHLVAVSPQCASASFFDLGISYNGINYMDLSNQPYDGTCKVDPDAPVRTPEAALGPVGGDEGGVLLRAAQVEQQCGSPFLGQYWLNMPRDGYNATAGNRPGVDDSPIMDWQTIRESGVAVLEIGGWFDVGVAGQLETQRLWNGSVVMLPRNHGNAVIRERYPNDRYDVRSEVLRWFDHHAKRIDNGAGWPGILYYTINAPSGQEWTYAPSWAAASAPRRTLYLNNGALSQMPGASAPVIYPQRAVPWFDGRYSGLARTWDGDMAAADAQSIVHTTDALESANELTGTPTARLWVSADQPDVNVFAVIEDVAPDGRSTYVTDGRLRASWRKLSSPPWEASRWNWHRGYSEDISPLISGEPVELVFDFFPASYVFAAGHSIRVSLVTDTGEAFQAPPLANGAPVTLTLYRDGDHRSLVELPLREMAQ